MKFSVLVFIDPEAYQFSLGSSVVGTVFLMKKKMLGSLLGLSSREDNWLLSSNLCYGGAVRLMS